MGKKTLMALAVAASIAYGTKLVIDNLSDELDEETVNAFIRDQFVCDTLDGKTLVDWYREKEKKYTGDVLYFLGKAVKSVGDMLAISKFPEDLDQEHTVFQALIDEKSASVLECRMITFSKMSTGVFESFGNKDYIIVEDRKE